MASAAEFTVLEIKNHCQYPVLPTERVVYEDILLLGLDEESPLVSDVGEEGLDVDLPLRSQLLQHGVDDDVSSRPTDPGTAVDQQWSVLSLDVKHRI